MQGQEIDDRVILKKAQEGDAEAFGQLYQCYAPAIFRFNYAHLENRLDAEDLTEEVFLRAWRSLPRYQPKESSFLAYLFQIARNALIDHYRQSKRLDSHVPLETNLSAGAEHDPSEQAALHTEHSELRQVLGKLPQDYQTVLVLRFLNELSPQETALVMGRSRGAIRVLQHRALTTLRDLINHR